MPADEPLTTRRLALILRKPWYALYWGVKPTVSIERDGHPAQWGVGTWQTPADRSVTVRIYLYNRVWKFGRAEFRLEPGQPAELQYTAPVLAFLPGRIRPPATR